MKPIAHIFAIVLVIAASVLIAGRDAVAGIVSVDTTQATIPISATGPSTVTVIWQVVRLGGSAPTNPGTISSPSGTLLINGVSVGTVTRTLSRFADGVPPSTNESLIFTETFSVSQAVAFRAIKSGVPIVYQRTFTDSAGAFGGNPASLLGSTLLRPSGPGSVPLSISRLQLRFDDGSLVKVLPKNTRLRAIAELNTSGVGLIRGEWEIATAASTRGAPVFRTLALVRQPAAAGRLTTITSPPLPTDLEGSNLVRLRITDPATFFEEPELQYYVTPESPLPENQQPRRLLTTSPGAGVPLTPTTRFAWQAIPGAALYKLEIYGTPPGPSEIVAENEVTTPVPLDPKPDTGDVEGRQPLTGVVVPSAITELRLEDYTLAHLTAERRYLWTVKALGKDGALLGISPPQEIYKP